MSGSRNEAVNELSTIRDCIRWGASQMVAAGLYFGHGTDNAWDEASLLVLHALHLPWDVDPSAMDARLTRSEREQVIALLGRRIDERLPAPYLTGEAWFAGLPFFVTPDVLIPRSPIAELIANGFEPWLGLRAPERILDLCCGSGCIGIAAALAFPDAQVVLADISEAALQVAQRNVARHELEDRVQLVQSDGFGALEPQRFDLLLCNPPYVNAEDLASMPAEYRREPELALTGGDDGLDLVRQLMSEARDWLSGDGLLVLEVGNSWPALEAGYPELELVWPEFEHGGHGVCLIDAGQLHDLGPMVGKGV